MIVLAMAFGAQAQYVQGDANGDNAVNMDDLTALINYLVFGEWPSSPAPSANFVDLGLPSGTLWATCNVGATTPEGYGDYFAWGEVAPKDNYSWQTYLLGHIEGSSIYFDKYCTNATNGTVDDKFELELEDDAAYVNMGAGWRMPTEEQMKELKDKCSRTWTEINGVSGHTFTGPNGNTIFLPAAGSRMNANAPSGLNTNGNYWSRNLKASGSSYTTMSGAKIYFSKTSIQVSSGQRSNGCVVRAVYEGSEPVPAGDFEQGDANGDGKVNMDDLTALINYLVFGVWPDTPAVEEYVDLGLPSGTLWSTRNIGANKPEDFGDYFGWGEVVPNKDDYSWGNTQWLYTENGQKRISKYNTNSQYGEVDNLTELELEDDAAYVNWGADWRMPSKAQLDELLANCTWEWTQKNGTNGVMLTGTNGNTMFLPTAGYRLDDDFFGLGASGNYWTRSLQVVSETYTNPLGAYKIFFNNGNLQSQASDRNAGCTVRPVRASQE